MIVEGSELSRHRGRLVMVDGCFDPLHAGHVEYFRAASELGLPILCNVTGDGYLAGKHPPLLSHEHRVKIVDAIRYIDFTHPSVSSTAEVLDVLRPRYFVKGADARGRLPIEEVRACERHDVEIVFVDTWLASSSEILASYVSRAGSP